MAKASALSAFMDGMKDSDLSLMAEGKHSAEFDGYIDSGSYMFNALLGASMYGGFPNNKVLQIVGGSTTGKTYMVLSLMKDFLNQYPDGAVMFYDTESAVTEKMLRERGIDPNRIMIKEPETVEQFRTMAVRFLDYYLDQPKTKRIPMLMVLDSLGGLPSEAEVEKITEGRDNKDKKEKKDMSRPGIIKGAFRAIRLRLAKAKIPMLVTNHVYKNTSGQGPLELINGGSGAYYASDEIMWLTKAQNKGSDNTIKGNFITVKAHKSRLTIENTKVILNLDYKKGLDRYFGLLEFGTRFDVFKKGKSGNFTAYAVLDEDGKAGDMKAQHSIYAKPEGFFTDEVMARLEALVQREFTYGGESQEGEEFIGTDYTEESTL